MRRDYTKRWPSDLLCLHKNGDGMGVSTRVHDAADLDMYMARALEYLIGVERYSGDWAFQLEHWLPWYADLRSQLANCSSTWLEAGYCGTVVAAINGHNRPRRTRNVVMRLPHRSAEAR